MIDRTNSRPTHSSRILSEIDLAIRGRDIVRAKHLAQSLNQSDPQNIDGWIARARVSQMAGDYVGMRIWLKTALTLAPKYSLARLMDAEAMVHLGEIKNAQKALQIMEVEAAKDGEWLARIAEIYTHCGQFEKAADCARKAHNTLPENTAIGYNFASALIAVGELVAAEEQFDKLLEQTPHDYDVYYNRASLRKQTRDNNHIDEIKAVLSNSLKTPMGAVQLNYALAKELEDIGEYKQSFAALKRGADARRKMMSYKVETDTSAIAQIGKTFGANFISKTHTHCDHEGPIFILGYPRSGTTLIDRILSAHFEVESLGELTDFAMALTDLCKAQDGKLGLIEAAAHIDMKTLGATYVKRARERAHGSRFFIDKTPANFLYIGLIAKALPNAKIIHVNRNLADNGYGMYKALFRMGYPFSYNLGDLAAYMNAKEKLMAHWRQVLPGRIIDIHYEDVVASQEEQTRRLLAALELDWDATCLDFHKNKSPSATASAAQVRQPIYKSAVDRWKLYEKQLSPLTDALGITS